MSVPIDYSNILFWFVDVQYDCVDNQKNILENYKDLNGDKINLFDYVVIKYQKV